MVSKLVTKFNSPITPLYWSYLVFEEIKNPHKRYVYRVLY